VWTPNIAASSTKILLALAGGGGGGGGGGNNAIWTPGSVMEGNLYNRSFTSSLTTLGTINEAPDSFSAGGGLPYRLAGTNSDGQGSTNYSNFYPPGTVVTLIGTGDHGGGGGGGGGNGYGGGISRSANNYYEWVYTAEFEYDGTIYPASWTHPSDFAGVGGSQGFSYTNLDYYEYPVTYTYGRESAYLGQGYGLGTGNSSGVGAAGGSGAAWLKVTNDQYDTTHPS
jgi:hypothetical protein